MSKLVTRGNIKKMVLLVCALIFLVVITNAALAEKKEEEKEEYTFGFVFGVTDPFYFTMQRGAQKKADELGVKMVFQFPEKWSPEVQAPIVDAMVARGDIDFLVVVATDTEAMVPVLKKAYDKGIALITVDGHLWDADYSKPGRFVLSAIGTDNFLGGEAAGEVLAKAVDYKGKCYIQISIPGHPVQAARADGFRSVVEKYPEMEEVGWDVCNNDPDIAQAQTKAFLEKNPDVNVIWGCNLFAGIGAAMAVKNMGLQERIEVGTYDATPFVIEKVEEGLFDVVIAQLPGQMGEYAVEWGYRYLKNNEKPPYSIPTGYEVFTQENYDDPDMQQYIYVE